MKSKNLSISRRPYSWIIVLALMLLPLAGQANEETFAKQVFQRYENLNSYCDKGMIRKWIRYDEERAHSFRETQFDRCFQSNGLSKHKEYQVSLGHEFAMHWSDGEMKYVYRGYYNGAPDEIRSIKPLSYNEYPIKISRDINNKNRQKTTAISILDIFHSPSSFSSHPITSRYEIISYLNRFQVNHQLSNAEFTVMDYLYPTRNRTANEKPVRKQIWVSNQSMLIKKYREYIGENLNESVEIYDSRINPELTQNDLWYDDVPLFVLYGERYSLDNRPGVFISAAYVLTFLFGTLFWSLFFLKNSNFKVRWSSSWIGKHSKYRFFVVIVFLSIIYGNIPGVIINKLEFLIYIYPLLFYIFAGYCGFLIFLLSSHAAYWLSDKLMTRNA